MEGEGVGGEELGGGREGAKGRLRESRERAPGPEAREGSGEHREARAGRNVEGQGRC